jgi:serine/threonine protein kinase
MADAEARPARHTETTLTRFSLGEHEPEPIPPLLKRRYEVGRLIGRGATARVFRAYDRLDRRRVAVKLFHPGAVPTEERRRLKEIQILSRLQHPGLVALYDAGTQDGQAFLAMELVDGPNLADRIAGGPLEAAEVAELAVQLSAALAYVHRRGVTHRDLKPANVLLAPDRPLISDFGIAQAFDSTQITATGMVVGTAAYMAPEQVLGEEVGPPSDVYALGLVLLECLTGVREYAGTMVESAVGRLHRTPRLPAGLPPTLETMLRRMTARQPSDRPTAQAVHQALRTDEDTMLLPAIVPKAPYRHRKLLAAGVPAAAAAIIAAALLLSSGTDTTPSPVQPVAATPSSEAPPGSTVPPRAIAPAAAEIAVEATATPGTPPPVVREGGSGGGNLGDGNQGTDKNKPKKPKQGDDND